MTDKKTPGYIIIRVWHPTDDLEDVASWLLIPMMRSWIAGTQRQTPTGRDLPGVNKESYWCSEKQIFFSDEGFQDVLISTVDRLQAAGNDFRNITASGGRIELYLQLPGSVNNGGILNSVLLKTLGELSVDLLVEVFPNTE